MSGRLEGTHKRAARAKDTTSPTTIKPPAAAAEPKARLALERMLPYRIRLLSKRIGLDAMRLYSSRFKLSIPEWQILAVLGEAQPMSASRIAQMTPMDRPQVSRTVRRMIARGLLVMTGDRVDGRRSLIWMTQAGADVHDKIVPLALLREARLLDALTAEERKTLDEIIEKLNDRIVQLDAGGL
jgi:DNA-binding MarR family transcriptional regulator